MPDRVHIPEIVPVDAPVAKVDPWVEKLAWLMDGMIPIGRWSIGLDGILGLIPGLGDLAGALISMLIVLRAVQSGIPRIAIARMMTNIAIDTLVGSIPLLGDAFDFAYKSNLKNLRIYEDALRRGRHANASHWAFFAMVFLAAGALFAAAAAAFLALLHALSRLL